MYSDIYLRCEMTKMLQLGVVREGGLIWTFILINVDLTRPYYDHREFTNTSSDNTPSAVFLLRVFNFVPVNLRSKKLSIRYCIRSTF